VHAVKTQFAKEADQLYRGKILIDRARTRDIMPATMNAAQLKKHFLKMNQGRTRQEAGRRTVSHSIRNTNTLTFSSVIEAPNCEETSP